MGHGSTVEGLAMSGQSKRVLVTGHLGYIGSVLTPLLDKVGHDVCGLDSGLFENCLLGDAPPSVPTLAKDIRDVTCADLEGIDAVVHLAAISNDPLGDLNPNTTHDINHRAVVTLARAAKQAGVERFVQSSSCSLYGAHGNDLIDESASFLPVTPYGESKVMAERDVSALASDDFSPTFLRNATVYGVSPRLRGDLVVNNLTGFAVTTHQVFLKSDGLSWRPLLHVEDLSRAVIACLAAPRDKVHNEAYNVGATDENYQIRDVAELVHELVDASEIAFADAAGPDLRNYRVNCDKLGDELGFSCEWTVRRGIEELRDAFIAEQLTIDQLEGSRFMRVARVRRLIDAGDLGADLRWTSESM